MCLGCKQTLPSGIVSFHTFVVAGPGKDALRFNLGLVRIESYLFTLLAQLQPPYELLVRNIHVT